MADITDDELQSLINQGLSQNEIARRTGIPRSTLQRRYQELGVPKGNKGVPLGQRMGIHDVYNSTQISKQAAEAGDELQELLTWWRERKLTVQMSDDPEQETERKTYHVQKRYIEAIQRASDIEHVSITEIVNRAFAHYFNRTHD